MSTVYTKVRTSKRLKMTWSRERRLGRDRRMERKKEQTGNEKAFRHKEGAEGLTE